MHIVLKYIITRDGACLFPEAMVHLAIAHGYQELKVPILSAGFALFHEGSMKLIKCYGESESLKISSHPEIDKQVINNTLNSMNQIKYGLMNVADMYAITNILKDKEDGI